ncbi:MAG: YihY/virulence factor BrkB family protein, partial [Rhodanobacteraceae bacterium]
MFRTIWEMLKTIGKDFFENSPFQLAAALSYYTLLSMAPLLLLMTGVAGLAFGRATARAQVLGYVDKIVGSQEADVVRTLMSQAGNHHAGVVSTAIGTAVLVVGATTVFAHLQTALNQIWGVAAAPGRNAIWRLLGTRLVALAIVLGMACVLLVSMALSVAIASTEPYISQLFPGADNLARAIYVLLSFAIVTGMIALLFRYVPDCEIDWRDALLGALITSVLFAAGKFALGVYLARLRYSSAGAA